MKIIIPYKDNNVNVTPVSRFRMPGYVKYVNKKTKEDPTKDYPKKDKEKRNGY